MNNATQEHLLRMEGVNLSAVLDDTSEISVHRGAGLMLRKAVQDVTIKFSDLQPISRGASIGLFWFHSEDPGDLVGQVADWLNDHPDYSWLTFVVDCAPLKPGFKKAQETVIALNRIRQFQQMTLTAPEHGTTGGCCKMNRLLPAGKHRDKKESVSDSVHARFNYGRDNRQEFYRHELGKKVTLQFTEDLTDLSLPAGDQDFGNLNGKMAVIYLDGNKFGEIQRDCKTPEELERFDQYVQKRRRDFLDTLLEKAKVDNSFFHHKLLRLETLLWGGDEILLVVPAWKGMEVLQLFYECSVDWIFDNKKPLTHAGGIVFCHHKTPIAQVKRTAKDLAEGVKKATPRQNRFDYLVLESIDYPTQALSDYWRLRYGPGVKQRCPPLPPFTKKDDTPWRDRLIKLNGVLEQLPRGAIYDIGQCWVEHWNTPDKDSRLKERIERFQKVSGDAYASLFENLFGYFVADPPKKEKQQETPGWLHLTELWDYLAPMNSKGKETGQ